MHRGRAGRGGRGQQEYTLNHTNYQISNVKHVLTPLYVFFTLFGCWRGGGGEGLPRGLGHNLLMQFSRLGSSKVVLPSPFSRCLAEGNIISPAKECLHTPLPSVLMPIVTVSAPYTPASALCAPSPPGASVRTPSAPRPLLH